MLIARHGKVCYRERAGEASAGVALQEDALFRIYSMTKAITTTALMTLCAPPWQLSLHPGPVTVSQRVQAPAVRGRSRHCTCAGTYTKKSALQPRLPASLTPSTAGLTPDLFSQTRTANSAWTTPSPSTSGTPGARRT